MIPGNLPDAEFEEVLDEVMRPRKTRRLVVHLSKGHGVVLGSALDPWLEDLPRRERTDLKR